MGNVIGVDTSYTGNPVSFVAANGGTMKSISVPLTYTQDLHGYANPWPGGGGDNLIDFTTVLTNGWSNTSGDLTAEYSNGYMHVYGTNNTSGYVNIVDFQAAWTNPNLQFSAGTYIMAEHIVIRCYVDGGSVANKTASFTAASSVAVRGFFIAVSAGATVDWNIPMMFVRGSTRPTTFSPYSNICPISGRTGLSVYRTGKNLVGITLSQHNANNVITNVFSLPKGTFAISVGSSVTMGGMYLRNGSTISAPAIAQIYNSNTLTVTLTEAYSELILQLYKVDGVPVSDIEYVQIEADSATTYEPYNGNTYSVDWTTQAGTVYGGTLDVVTGLLTVDKVVFATKWSQGHDDGISNGIQTKDFVPVEMADVSDITKIACNVCSVVSSFGVIGLYPYAASAFYVMLPAGTDGNTDIQMLYPLATPQTFQLTPKQIAALVGQNYIWANNNQTLSVVLTAPMTGFAGWLIKCVTNGTPVEIPLKYMRAETYTVTPDQRMEWSAERDVTGVLHRETVQNLPPKIEFNTPLMTNADINALNSIIKAAFTSYLQRNITIQFYDPERDQYWEWDCYMPDVHYQIRNADTTNHVINYEELRYAFIGY